jgi:alpha/beta superfamily hydrolase
MCSNTGKEDWTDFAVMLQKRGYMTLTYYYRGIKPSGGTRVITNQDKDIAAAVSYVKGRGADKIVLVGASCGGTISTIEATKTPVEGLVVIGSPGNIEGMGATDEALQTVTAPKLFISSEGDQWTGPMMELYEKMSDPKESHIYPGSVHGTGLFFSEHGQDFTQRLIRFVESHAPLR